MARSRTDQPRQSSHGHRGGEKTVKIAPEKREKETNQNKRKTPVVRTLELRKRCFDLSYVFCTLASLTRSKMCINEAQNLDPPPRQILQQNFYTCGKDCGRF